jgi:peptidoglycan hydrolase-like protein with peptidoglycan-binding domain
MPELSYRQPGLVLRAGGPATTEQIRDLQRDLRRLGYLREGIDGSFGTGTARAVQALQHDLLTNDGSSRAGDGSAPVRLMDLNRGVTAVTGEADQPLVESIGAMLDDARIPALPMSNEPVQDNLKIVAELRKLPAGNIPTPFLLAILKQESDLKHFNEPSGNDTDGFITTGLDNGTGVDYIITSRGYGAGQYTLFHHPPTAAEVSDLMLDVGKNVRRASSELRDKFDHFVIGGTSAANADDRIAEAGTDPLRVCRFSQTDSRFLTGCAECLAAAGYQDIVAGTTPLFPGSTSCYQPTALRNGFTRYSGVPVRGAIGCDWPYAVRRYNGSGMDSYHYQAQVLLNLKELTQSIPAPGTS